ncbi:MAG TPA: 30S ribosomal protein S16 [Patescibacteria group bacterium]|nr:30S ribosomal protein S16 [Patescibacteria group bacterium]
MLVIRMQRTGRSGHAQFRVVVQDSRRTPTSGKVVASLGHFDPHTKQTSLDKEKASFYLEHGAQPSERVVRLLQAEGVKLPEWVSVSSGKQRTVRNADKRRSTRPPEPEAPTKEASTAEASAEQAAEAEPEASEVPAEVEAAVEPAPESSETPVAEESPEPEVASEPEAAETPAEEPEVPEEAAKAEAASEDSTAEAPTGESAE